MSKPIGYTITLVRTGGTSWDDESRLIGKTDLPMTDQGSDEVARAIHECEFPSPFSMILVSDEEASQRAARMLPQSSDTKVKTITQIGNVDLGLWEGVLSSDLQERSPSTYAQWSEHPERIAPPEGESLVDAQDRLLSAIEKSLSKCKGTHPNVAIVLRPLAWAVARCWFTGDQVGSLWAQLDQPNTLEHFEVMKSSFTERKQSSRASA
jgi:broad specificity phosphatase PhoE